MKKDSGMWGRGNLERKGGKERGDYSPQGGLSYRNERGWRCSKSHNHPARLIALLSVVLILCGSQVTIGPLAGLITIRESEQGTRTHLQWMIMDDVWTRGSSTTFFHVSSYQLYHPISHMITSVVITQELFSSFYSLLYREGHRQFHLLINNYRPLFVLDSNPTSL